MTERTVRIGICIKDRVTRQLACAMFGNAGARVEVCEDLPALLEIADHLQGIVLGLDATPDPTFDALAALRKRSATLPIDVISDTAGQRHTKRAELLGATHVVAHGQLQLRVGSLVQEMAHLHGISDWGVRAPGWMPMNLEQGYDIESMDLDVWLSIPGNRTLLGIAEEPAGATAATTRVAPPGRTEEGPNERRTAASSACATRPTDTPAVPVGAPLAPFCNPDSAGSATPPRGNGTSPDCPQIVQCRALHEAQNNAILEAHIQREKRLRADLKSEFLQSITRQIAASEATTQERVDETLARSMLETTTALRRMKLLAGITASLAVLAVGAAILVSWQAGLWP